MLEPTFISKIIELNEDIDALASLRDLNDLKNSNIREIDNLLKYFLKFVLLGWKT